MEPEHPRLNKLYESTILKKKQQQQNKNKIYLKKVIRMKKTPKQTHFYIRKYLRKHAPMP